MGLQQGVSSSAVSIEPCVLRPPFVALPGNERQKDPEDEGQWSEMGLAKRVDVA